MATPSSCHRGAVATADGQGRPVFLAWLMDHRGCYALLSIDVDAGKAEEHPVPFPLGDSPFASILSSRGKFYSHFGSHFVEFDPAKRAFTFCRKTAPQMAMSMTEDQHGVIWSATYPQSGLVSFDPETGQFTDYGHLYKQNWAEYPRSVAADDAGWVYLGVGSTACQIVAFDSASRQADPLVPGERADARISVPSSRARTARSTGSPMPRNADNWLVLYQGKATTVGQRPKFTARPLIAGSQGLYPHRVSRRPPRARALICCERSLVVEDPKTKSQKTIRFECQSEGAHVMGVAAAPNGTICGGSAFPMRFFSYDPRRRRVGAACGLRAMEHDRAPRRPLLRGRISRRPLARVGSGRAVGRHRGRPEGLQSPRAHASVRRPSFARPSSWPIPTAGRSSWAARPPMG